MMNISEEELSKTCSEANRLMRHLRGRVVIFDMITLLCLCVFIWPVILVSVLLSVFAHIAAGIALFIVYIMTIGCWILCT